MRGHGDDDPYEDAFVLASRSGGNGQICQDAVLSETQWRVFLASLVDGHLLSSATAARFSTDFHGARSLCGFQDQLVCWALPEHDALRSMDDAFETLEVNTALVERMVAGGTSTRPPAFVASLAARVRAIADDLREAETTCRRDLASYARDARLFGKDATTPARVTSVPTSHAWQFQRDHQAFLLREERRRRPVRVERHTTDAASRQVLLETFPTRLATARDISVTMASATVAATEDDPDARSPSPATTQKTELVVVLAVQRRLARSDDVEWLDTQVAAHRELLLSPYVQQYLGHHEVESGDHGRIGGNRGSEGSSEQLYCFELAPVTTLGQLLDSNGELFQPDALIVRYFAREILLAMVDLVDQSTHEWRTRLTPTNVLLSASRRRVLLGRMEFGPPIDVLAVDSAPIDHHLVRREAALLGDLAVLLFAMVFRATLPTNLSTFRAHYLIRADISHAFTSEFLVTNNAESMSLRVCRGDRFALVFLVDGAAWLLMSVSSLRLRLEEQRSSPVPTFTFVATHAGAHRLEFAPMGSLSRAVVQVTVSAGSYLHDPPTRWTTLVESCARSSATLSTSLSLRQLLDHHSLFQSLESDADVAALDSALELCGAGA